jgi:GEVED domain/Ig-like domain CHU_C associated/Secretion system C-terminal sorting domain
MKKNYFNSIKRCIATLLIGIVANIGAYATVVQYTFSQSSGTYTPISGGTVLGTATNDDNVFPALPLGFTFFYNGAAYTSASVNANGLMALGNTLTSSYNGISTGSTNNVIALFNRDLLGLDVTGSLQFLTIGSAPNRKFIVQWTNYRNYSTPVAGPGTGETYNGQIVLSETSNTIDLIYGTFTPANVINTTQFEIGLRGNASTDFNNRKADTLTSFFNTTIAGALANDNVKYSKTLGNQPTSGLTFTYTPQPGSVAPINLTFTAVALTGMTLNFQDNSTDESAFIIFRSTDNINFLPVTTVPSTTTAATGGAYTSVQTGLLAGTTYYWRVVAVNNTPGAPVSGTQATLTGTICGTFTVGPTGTYTSVTAAVAAIVASGTSCPVILELQAAYVSTVETFPIAIPNLGNTSNITIRPELGATNLSITTALLAINTFTFNGSSNITIDGRPGGVGTTKQLTVRNDAVAGGAIVATNGANTLSFNYLFVQGANTSTTGGVIQLLSPTTSSTNGISITNSELYNSTALLFPTNLIYATGATSNISNVTISNNKLHDNFNAGLQASAVRMDLNCRNFTITNNGIYQTASRTYTAGATHVGINSTSTANNGGFFIDNNYIGGGDELAGGTALTMLGAFANRYFGMNIATSAAAPLNTITNNKFYNINVSTTSGAVGVIVGISASGSGNAVVSNNTIGSGLYSTTFTTSTSAGSLVGLSISTSGLATITSNTIDNLVANGSTATIVTGVTGIIASTSVLGKVNNNTVGSAAFGLKNSANTNTATSTTVTGISVNFTSAGAHEVNGNTVTNLQNLNTGINTGLILTRGMFVSFAGAATLNNNTVSKITSQSANTSTVTTTPAVAGIIFNNTATVTPVTISGNLISDITSAPSPAAATTVSGLVFSGANFNNRIFNNKISGLASTSTLGTSVVNGLVLTAGNGTIYNNMITLGSNGAGAEITTPNQINGIFKNSTVSNSLYNNSVSIHSGSIASGVTAGTANTFAFARSATPTVADTVKNNIFSNTRLYSGAAGTNYAIGLTSAVSGFISDFNCYYSLTGANSAIGLTVAAPQVTYSDWVTANSGQEASSRNSDPKFVSTTDLHINNATSSSLESKGTTVAIAALDIDGQNRPGPTAVNGGGTAYDIGADEFDGIPVLLDMGISALANPLAANCKTASENIQVEIKNFSVQAINFALNPITISGSVSGINPLTFTPVVINTGTLASGATQTVTLATGYNAAAVGTYTFATALALAGDGTTSNNNNTTIITVANGSFVAATTKNCGGSNIVLTATGVAASGTSQWQVSQDNVAFSPIASATTNPYTYTLGNVADTVYIRHLGCGSLTSTSDTIIIFDTQAPVASGVARCGPGTVNLSATSAGSINWYAAALGGAPLASGSTYSPSVTASTTYYAESVSGGTTFSVGAPNNTTGSFIAGGQQASTAYNTFDVTTACLLTGTTVYPGALTGNIVIDYLTSTGTVIQTVTYAIPASYTTAGVIGAPLFVPLNISLTPGTNYRLGQGIGSVSMFRANTVTTTLFPFTIPGVLSITGTSAGTSFYYFTFNWQILTGCLSARTAVAVIVSAPPAINASAANPSLCVGGNTVLTATSANAGYTYSWSPAATLSAATGASVTATPLANETYTVTANDAISGCQNQATVAVTVNPLPVVTASNPAAICANSNTSLSASASIPVTYCAPTYTSANTSGDYITLVQLGTINNATVGAAALPNYTLFPEAGSTTTTIPAGVSQTITLAAGTFNANDIAAWIDYNQDGVFDAAEKLGQTDNFAAGPATTSFTFTVPITAYDGKTRLRVRERDGATPNIDPCGVETYGEVEDYTVTITGGTALITYSWSPSTFLSSSTVANPTVSAATTTTNYIVTATSLAGCPNTASVALTVNALPAVTATATAPSVCVGSATTLTGGGATSYTWDNGITDGVAFNPTATLTYTVTGTDANGCSNTATQTVTVNALPTITANASSTSVCAGSSVTLTGGGAATYTWDNGVTNGVAITPAATATYNVTGTDANGCQGTASTTVTVNAQPTANLPTTISTCNATEILDAGNATLSGVSYLWSNGAITQTITASTNGNYSVTVTGTGGCSVSDTVNVTLNSGVATANVSATSVSICEGTSTTLVGTPSGGTFSANGTGAIFNGTATGTFDVTYTVTTSCGTAIDTVSLTVNANPVTSITPSSPTICAGGATAVILTGSPAGGTFSVQSGTASALTGNSFNPAATGTWTIVYSFTNASGCPDTSNINFNVNCTVGLNDLSKGVAAIQVVPNPTSGNFDLNISNAADNATIKLLSFDGRLLSTEKVDLNQNNTVKMNIANYANGIYFVNVTSGNVNKTIKITKQD